MLYFTYIYYIYVWMYIYIHPYIYIYGHLISRNVSCGSLNLYNVYTWAPVENDKMCQYANLSLIEFFRKQTESVDVPHAEKNNTREACILASFTHWRPLNLCNPSPILPRMYWYDNRWKLKYICKYFIPILTSPPSTLFAVLRNSCPRNIFWNLQVTLHLMLGKY